MISFEDLEQLTAFVKHGTLVKAADDSILDAITSDKNITAVVL